MAEKLKDIRDRVRRRQDNQRTSHSVRSGVFRKYSGSRQDKER